MSRESFAAPDASAFLHLPRTTIPLLTPDRAETSGEIVTVADPFPIVCANRLYVLAEIEGRRRDGRYFKKIGAFEIAAGLRDAEYLGETWPEDDGEYSFPYVFRWGDDFVMLPDVNLPGQPAQKRFRIYSCPASDFPHGWRCLSEATLKGVQLPSDKVLVNRDGVWYLFVSDAQGGGRLHLFYSEDRDHWQRHPGSPLLRRTLCDRALNRYLPHRYYRSRPWRLGGGAVEIDGQLILFAQHMAERKLYGEAVTPLAVLELTPQSVRFDLGSKPVLKADVSIPWQHDAAHHVAFCRYQDRYVVATDGFDGRLWSSHAAFYEPPNECSFAVPETQSTRRAA